MLDRFLMFTRRVNSVGAVAFLLSARRGGFRFRLLWVRFTRCVVILRGFGVRLSVFELCRWWLNTPCFRLSFLLPVHL